MSAPSKSDRVAFWRSEAQPAEAIIYNEIAARMELNTRQARADLFRFIDHYPHCPFLDNHGGEWSIDCPGCWEAAWVADFLGVTPRPRK